MLSMYEVGLVKKQIVGIEKINVRKNNVFANYYNLHASFQVVKYKYGKIKCTMTALEALKNEKE